MIGDCPHCGARRDCLSCALEVSYAAAVRAHCDGLIGRWMTVDSSKLYARLCHPSNQRRSA